MTSRDNISEELRDLTSIADRFDSRIPYQVPAGYFDRLADNILGRVKAQAASSAEEELQILSPLLGKMDKKTPFSVPEGYFNELKTKEAKVVRGSFRKKMLRYSAAAVVAGIIAAGGWFWVNSTAIWKADMATISTQEVTEKVQAMPDNEMKAFLEGTTNTVVYQNTPLLAELKTEDLNLIFTDISDEELQRYVEHSDAVISLN